MEGIAVARKISGGYRVKCIGEFIADYRVTSIESVIDWLKSATCNPGVHR
jgi:hypothetical protein